MTRKEQIEQASVNYQMSTRPKALGGDAFADLIYKANINPSFITGAEWADNTLIEKAQNFFRTTHHLHKLDGMELKNFIEDFRKMMKE